MLRRKLAPLPLGPDIWKGRQVQVEATVALAEAGAATFREGHAAVGVGIGIGVAVAVPTVIVAAFVAAQGLTGGEGPMADGALVGLTAHASGGGRGS